MKLSLMRKHVSVTRINHR